MASEPEPYANVSVKHPNGEIELYRCEVRVYSNERWDMSGHQCGKVARWRFPDVDKWGDMIVCGVHKNKNWGRSTHLRTIFGYVSGEPTSWRFQRTKVK